ncbi:transposase domain-containing protein [Sulfitobacter sp. CW3]|nr:transposase domain-containing protein [Sulfitobacter sp. CW3]MBW4960652.1 transposase domain-containing protein [Sulfitobacter sp. CW3]
MIETCKLNNIEPHCYLTQTLSAISTRPRKSRIEELLPWELRL